MRSIGLRMMTPSPSRAPFRTSFVDLFGDSLSMQRGRRRQVERADVRNRHHRATSLEERLETLGKFADLVEGDDLRVSDFHEWPFRVVDNREHG